MEIIKKSKTPNGIDIQIENWSKDYSSMQTFIIATYPICRNQNGSQWIIGGERFRCAIERFENNAAVLSAFEQLENGTKKIEEFAEQIELKNRIYLGIYPINQTMPDEVT